MGETVACPRQAHPRLAWGILDAIVGATLMALAVAAAMVLGHPVLRIATDGLGVLIVFGGMKAWVRANRVALALSAERRCCTSTVRIRVIEPTAAETETAEPELVAHKAPQIV